MSLPSLGTILTLSAMAASIVLLLHKGPRVLALIALLASALEALVRRGWVHIPVGAMTLSLILGGALVIAGVIMFTRASAKSSLASSTVIAYVGALQVLTALHH